MDLEQELVCSVSGVDESGLWSPASMAFEYQRLVAELSLKGDLPLLDETEHEEATKEAFDVVQGQLSALRVGVGNVLPAPPKRLRPAMGSFCGDGPVQAPVQAPKPARPPVRAQAVRAPLPSKPSADELLSSADELAKAVQRMAEVRSSLASAAGSSGVHPMSNAFMPSGVTPDRMRKGLHYIQGECRVVDQQQRSAALESTEAAAECAPAVAVAADCGPLTPHDAVASSSRRPSLGSAFSPMGISPDRLRAAAPAGVTTEPHVPPPPIMMPPPPPVMLMQRPPVQQSPVVQPPPHLVPSHSMPMAPPMPPVPLQPMPAPSMRHYGQAPPVVAATAAAAAGQPPLPLPHGAAQLGAAQLGAQFGAPPAIGPGFAGLGQPVCPKPAHAQPLRPHADNAHYAQAGHVAQAARRPPAVSRDQLWLESQVRQLEGLAKRTRHEGSPSSVPPPAAPVPATLPACADPRHASALWAPSQTPSVSRMPAAIMPTAIMPAVIMPAPIMPAAVPDAMASVMPTAMLSALAVTPPARVAPAHPPATVLQGASLARAPERPPAHAALARPQGTPPPMPPPVAQQVRGAPSMPSVFSPTFTR